jgi:hypothetical protein
MFWRVSPIKSKNKSPSQNSKCVFTAMQQMGGGRTQAAKSEPVQQGSSEKD